MARPEKLRCVAQLPNVGFFRPVGIPVNALQSVRLSLEELECIRLKDLEGLEQEECARQMRISRPTFHRILESARKKLADALINGKAIQIEGGNFELAQRLFRCGDDGHEWSVPFETMAQKLPLSCPKCLSVNIQPTPLASFGSGRGCGRRFRGGRRW
ncbi:MAG: DUF134 domain-containing protein [Dehalococcoidia bacterium]|jgi:predicted DNA-binding protein (UPF0251 family)